MKPIAPLASIKWPSLSQSDIDRFASGLSKLDNCTYFHSIRVSTLAIKLGQEMGVSGEKLCCLGLGGMLHDLGKARIPQSILDKRTPLSLEEWQSIQQHPMHGYEYLSKTSTGDIVKEIVLEHHRWANGKGGYPEHLGEQQPSLLTQIITVSDVFDAMTHERPYHPAFSTAYCIGYLKENVGTLFDGSIVERIERMF